mmetsp:Transcript_15909/g.29112  ORF Transcript_15909/g.29112 Transcript_15909/m.29112 type:complete len:229 (-) Transcript_15909:46-732(-)
MAVPAPQRKAVRKMSLTTSMKSASPAPAVSGVHVMGQSCHHTSQRVLKFNEGQAFEAATTLKICGKRNKMPLCIPEPRPTELRTPKPTHQITYIAISSTSFAIGFSVATSAPYPAPAAITVTQRRTDPSILLIRYTKLLSATLTNKTVVLIGDRKSVIFSRFSASSNLKAFTSSFFGCTILSCVRRMNNSLERSTPTQRSSQTPPLANSFTHALCLYHAPLALPQPAT